MKMHSRDLYFLGQRGMTCKPDMMKSSHYLIRRWLIKQGNKSLIVDLEWEGGVSILSAHYSAERYLVLRLGEREQDSLILHLEPDILSPALQLIH